MIAFITLATGLNDGRLVGILEELEGGQLDRFFCKLK